jgi:hypothetical protein
MRAALSGGFLELERIIQRCAVPAAPPVGTAAGATIRSSPYFTSLGREVLMSLAEAGVGVRL